MSTIPVLKFFTLGLAISFSFGLALHGQSARGAETSVESEVAELADLPSDELGWELLGLLPEWSGTNDGSYAVPFAHLEKRDQARAVIAAIEANHDQNRQHVEQPGIEVMAVLMAAIAVDDPYDLFDDGSADHPLLDGITPQWLRLSLGPQPMGMSGLGDTFRDVLRVQWIDYNGRADLDGMTGEEAPSPFELWLFDVRNPTTLCNDDEVPAWSVTGDPENPDRVHSICMARDVSDGKGRVTYRNGSPESVEFIYPRVGVVPREAFRFVPDGTRGQMLSFGENAEFYPEIGDHAQANIEIYVHPADSYEHFVWVSDSAHVYSWDVEPAVDQLNLLQAYLDDPTEATLPASDIELTQDAAESCPGESRPVWVCHAPGTEKVAALCTSGAGDNQTVSFHFGEAANFVLDADPDMLSTPQPLAGALDIWARDGELIAQVSAGLHQITLMRSSGPAGTDGSLSSEFNGNPNKPLDCNIALDRVGEEFGDRVPCPDRFDPEACPWAYILPHSNERPVMMHELRGLSEEQLYLAMEEIFVRHGQVSEEPLTLSRSWYIPLGDVRLSQLSPVEQQNMGMILEQIQLFRPDDAAQWHLPAAYGDWQAEVEFEDRGKAMIYGSDHRVRVEYEDGYTLLYLPRESLDRVYDAYGGDVYVFNEDYSFAVLDDAYRFPWLLSTGILEELKVKVTNQYHRRILGENELCLDLSGSMPLYEGGPVRVLEGTACYTSDGIPDLVQLSGTHDTEGQEELFPWSYNYLMRSLDRVPLPESLFVPPTQVKTWIRPG